MASSCSSLTLSGTVLQWVPPVLMTQSQRRACCSELGLYEVLQPVCREGLCFSSGTSADSLAASCPSGPLVFAAQRAQPQRLCEGEVVKGSPHGLSSSNLKLGEVTGFYFWYKAFILGCDSAHWYTGNPLDKGTSP